MQIFHVRIIVENIPLPNIYRVTDKRVHNPQTPLPKIKLKRMLLKKVGKCKEPVILK